MRRQQRFGTRLARSSPERISGGSSPIDSRACLLGRLAAAQRLDPRADAETLQQGALVDRSVSPGADLAGGTGQGGEVDVGGQVGAARFGQDRMGGMTTQGLESGANAWRPVAVVDDQRGAAMGGQAPADVGGDRDGRGRDLDHRARRGGVQLRGYQCLSLGSGRP